MLKVTLRNLLARKVRLVLSGLAIVIGVAFVAGSFIFTDTLRATFDGIVKGTTADVQVCPKGACSFDSVADTRTIPASVVRQLGRLPGAAAAHGNDQVQGVYVIGPDGKVVGGGGAPGLAFSFTPTKAITGNRILTLAAGRLPHGVHQIALDQQTVDKSGYRIGDTVHLQTPGTPPMMTARLTGIVTFGEGNSLAGATLTMWDRPAIQQLFFHGRDVFTEVGLTTKPGVSQVELRDQARRVLPTGVTARAGDAVAAQNQKEIGKILGFLNTFLLVFAAIALVVGIFLIINTFSILVAQRSRELALLRAMGASRRQVNRSVLLEALAVGFIGSTIGLGAGYLLAIALKGLFGLIGLDVSGTTMPVHVRTVVVSYVVGILVTLVAAYLPARRASRVAPVEAMRDDVTLGESGMGRRLVVGGVLIALGIAAIVAGWIGSGSGGLTGIGLGALAVLVGVSLLSPVVGRPVVAVLGALYRSLYGTVGQLATANSLRNPRRTAATASALMIGLTLVSTMAIFGQSTKASTEQAIRQTVTAPLIVSSKTQSPFSPAIAASIRSLPGVKTVAELRIASGKVDGNDATIGAADVGQLARTLNVRMAVGALSAAATHTILVDAGTAKANHLRVGERVPLRLQGGTQTVVVAGTFATNSMPMPYLVSLQTLQAGGLKPMDAYLFVSKAPKADIDTVTAEIQKTVAHLPTISLQTQQQFIDAQSKQIDQFLYMIYGLLALAIVIAILGIVNTLALSIIERTREIGLLRAVGLSRAQLRRMVRLESVVIAVLGAVLGVAMGIVFGSAMVRALADQGLNVLSIPWIQLVVFVVAAAVIGVLAAVLPARRAAKLDVLQAIATE